MAQFLTMRFHSSNMFRLFLLFIVFFFMAFPAAAQRFAYVDSEYILRLMPEYKSAQKKLDNTASDWEKEIERMKAEIAKMESEYQAERVLLTEALKKEREKAIDDKRKAMLAFQKEKFGFEGELFRKRQELVKPLQDKVFDAIQKVARDNALDFIFDKSGSLTMLFTNAKYDRSGEVLEILGISATAEDTQDRKPKGKGNDNRKQVPDDDGE